MSLREQHTDRTIPPPPTEPEGPAPKPAPRKRTTAPRTTSTTTPPTPVAPRRTTVTTPTETMTATVEKGLAKTVGLMLARVLAPGIITTLVLQNVIVLPAAMAPAAAWFGLEVR